MPFIGSPRPAGPGLARLRLARLRLARLRLARLPLARLRLARLPLARLPLARANVPDAQAGLLRVDVEPDHPPGVDPDDLRRRVRKGRHLPGYRLRYATDFQEMDVGEACGRLRCRPRKPPPGGAVTLRYLALWAMLNPLMSMVPSSRW